MFKLTEEGELTGFSATVNEVTDSSFTITYPSGETQSHNFVDIFFDFVV